LSNQDPHQSTIMADNNPPVTNPVPVPQDPVSAAGCGDLNKNGETSEPKTLFDGSNSAQDAASSDAGVGIRINVDAVLQKAWTPVRKESYKGNTSGQHKNSPVKHNLRPFATVLWKKKKEELFGKNMFDDEGDVKQREDCDKRESYCTIVLPAKRHRSEFLTQKEEHEISERPASSAETAQHKTSLDGCSLAWHGAGSAASGVGHVNVGAPVRKDFNTGMTSGRRRPEGTVLWNKKQNEKALRNAYTAIKYIRQQQDGDEDHDACESYCTIMWRTRQRRNEFLTRTCRDHIRRVPEQTLLKKIWL